MYTSVKVQQLHISNNTVAMSHTSRHVLPIGIIVVFVKQKTIEEQFNILCLTNVQ